MKSKIRYQPAYSLLVVTLNPGEAITAEAGSMTYMQPTIEVKTRKREKGFLRHPWNDAAWRAVIFCQ